MKTLKTFLVVFLSGLVGGVAFAEAPPRATLEKVSSIITRISEDLDSNRYDDALKEELSSIIATYGVEGLAALSMHEPVLMEIFIGTPEFGYEQISQALLSQAKSEDELQETLLALAVAQIGIGQDPTAPAVAKSIRKAVGLSEVVLSSEGLDRLIDVANVSALELTSNSVAVASHYGNRLANLIRVRDRLFAIFGDSFVVQLINRIISRVQSHH